MFDRISITCQNQLVLVSGPFCYRATNQGWKNIGFRFFRFYCTKMTGHKTMTHEGHPIHHERHAERTM